MFLKLYFQTLLENIRPLISYSIIMVHYLVSRYFTDIYLELSIVQKPGQS